MIRIFLLLFQQTCCPSGSYEHCQVHAQRKRLTRCCIVVHLAFLLLFFLKQLVCLLKESAWDLNYHLISQCITGLCGLYLLLLAVRCLRGRDVPWGRSSVLHVPPLMMLRNIR